MSPVHTMPHVVVILCPFRFGISFMLWRCCRNRFWLIVPINEHHIINSNTVKMRFSSTKIERRTNERAIDEGKYLASEIFGNQKIVYVNLLIMTKSGWCFFLICSQMNVQFLPLILIPSRISRNRFSVRQNTIGNIFDMATMPTNARWWWWWWLWFRRQRQWRYCWWSHHYYAKILRANTQIHTKEKKRNAFIDLKPP